MVFDDWDDQPRIMGSSLQLRAVALIVLR